jgi:crotonobetainyl-CoA:carnitine CoA-transferase CaiB-like acyl-CoA transferase
VVAPQGVYRALGDDEWVAISVRDDADWQALGRAMGDPAWHGDAALSTAEGRRERHDEIDARIEAWTSQRGAREVEGLLQEAGVPAGAALDFRQLWHDPQLNARGAFREVTHPAFGVEVRATSQWERGPFAPPIDRPAPCFGEHNDEVLGRILGLDEAAIEQLKCDSIIADEIKAPVA